MAEKKIGGKVYRCDQLLGREPWQLLFDIKTLLVPLGGVLGAPNVDGFGGKDPTSAMASELFAALGSVDDNAVLDMMERLIRLCRCDGDPCEWGMKPASMNESFQVIAWVLEVQFSDFLSAGPLSSLLKKIPKTG
jgi:hypothetical protein